MIPAAGMFRQKVTTRLRGVEILAHSSNMQPRIKALFLEG
jgi:hypothetical protein